MKQAKRTRIANRFKTFFPRFISTRNSSVEGTRKFYTSKLVARDVVTLPKFVKRRSSRVDFRLRNPSSSDVVLVIKALFSIFDPHDRVETNMYFGFAHDFVLALRYLHFFSLLTYITDSTKFLRCLLFMDGRSQLQHSDTSTKSVKRRMLKHQRSSRVDF